MIEQTICWIILLTGIAISSYFLFQNLNKVKELEERLERANKTIDYIHGCVIGGSAFLREEDRLYKRQLKKA